MTDFDSRRHRKPVPHRGREDIMILRRPERFGDFSGVSRGTAMHLSCNPWRCWYSAPSRSSLSATKISYRAIYFTCVCLRVFFSSTLRAEFFEKSKSETHQDGNYVSLDSRVCRNKNTLLSLETAYLNSSVS